MFVDVLPYGYCRGVIIRESTQKGMYIRLMDYGRIHKVLELKELKLVPEEILMLPPFARRCKMCKIEYGFRAYERENFDKEFKECLGNPHIQAEVVHESPDFVEVGIWQPRTDLDGLEWIPDKFAAKGDRATTV